MIIHKFIKKCEFCEQKNHLIVWTYHRGDILGWIYPTTYLCNYHYRRIENVNTDDFTQRISTTEGRKSVELRYHFVRRAK